jgi:hypothetical protein
MELLAAFDGGIVITAVRIRAAVRNIFCIDMFLICSQ